MFYADSMGFLGLQLEILKTGPLVDPDVVLDLMITTSAPPFAKSYDEVAKAHLSFMAKLKQQESILDELGLKILPAIQRAPDDGNATGLSRLGIISTGLAYDGEHPFGGGFAAPDMGLTNEGRKFIKECASVGLIVDLSHSGDALADEALCLLRELDSFVMVSHAGLREVYDHPRNLPASILTKVADMGGIIGIPTMTFFLSDDDDTMKPFLDQVKEAIRLLGEDSVCVGTDGIHKNLTIEEATAHHKRMEAKLGGTTFRARFPDQPLELIERGAFRMEIIEEALRFAGLGSSIVEKIMGLNAKRFFDKALT